MLPATHSHPQPPAATHSHPQPPTATHPGRVLGSVLGVPGSKQGATHIFQNWTTKIVKMLKLLSKIRGSAATHSDPQPPTATHRHPPLGAFWELLGASRVQHRFFSELDFENHENAETVIKNKGSAATHSHPERSQGWVAVGGCG